MSGWCIKSLCASSSMLVCAVASYAPVTPQVKLTSADVACPISGGGCDAVLNSDYATLFGVLPLPLLGMLAYGVVAAAAASLAASLNSSTTTNTTSSATSSSIVSSSRGLPVLDATLPTIVTAGAGLLSGVSCMLL
jgi:uncharacterized membrane protein